MIRRWLAPAVVMAVVAAACGGNVQPLDDPGLGDLGRTSIVYAADGSVLAQWHAEEDRVAVGLDEVTDDLINAVIAIEDERFFQHRGVDLRAIARALVADLESGEASQGASTITQQYIKNVILTPEVSIDRKIEEATLAIRLEESLTKEEILERYLNTVYLGDGAYGVGAASAHYFNKHVSDLTLGESALIAALIQNPSRTDPFKNSDAALERRRIVLAKMAELGWITDEVATAADAEPLALAPPRPPEQARYPYFTEEVKRMLLDDPALGATPTDRYNMVFRGGLRINTTLDPVSQESAEAAIEQVMPDDGPSAAAVLIEPGTGYVRALVGGSDFYGDDSFAQFNLATQGKRQPGSAFKPFVLAAALESGLSLNSVFAGGASVTINTNSGPWLVENYEGSNFPQMSVAEATVFSVNVVYAQMVDAVGPDKVVELAAAAGIRTPLEPFHAIALGAQEVSVLEMASAYSTFAADGTHIDPIFVTSIETEDGVNLYQPVPVVTQAMSPDVARQVTAALTEVVRRGTAQNAQIGRPLAGKTGTSQAHRDAWFVGYTPALAAAVWVGFPEATISMEPPTTSINVVGGSYPAQIFRAFAAEALAGTGFGAMPTPDADGLVVVEIDSSTGYLAGPFCPREHVISIQAPIEQAPSIVCPIHNPDGVVAAGAGVVPDVIGRSLGEATATLQSSGYLITVSWVEAGDLPQGTVFNQTPSPGSPAQTGAAVELLVAGPEPGTTVPTVIGFPVDQAEARLADNGMGIEVIIEAEADANSALRRPGVVWKQDPAGGTAAQDVVRVWVNP